jgi:hypothetical protein
MKRSNEVEQRQHKRYLVKERSFAVLGPKALRLCHLIDIGRGGLSFRYFADKDEMNGETNALDILCGENYYIEKIPARNVSDRQLSPDQPFGSLAMRRRSVQFGEMTPAQVEQLENFILHNTYMMD